MIQKIVFTSLTNDAVSRDCGLIHETLATFLNGLLTYSGHTDPDHNVKNKCYQFVNGGNNAKMSGVILLIPERYAKQKMLKICGE